MNLNEIRERLEKITPGNWEIAGYIGEDCSLSIGANIEKDEGSHCDKADWIGEIDGAGDGDITEQMENDARFIVNAPDDIRDLLDEIDKRDKEIEKLKNQVNQLRGKAYPGMAERVVENES